MNEVFTMSNGTKYALLDEIYAGDRRFAVVLKADDESVDNYVICEVKLAKDGTLYLVDIRDKNLYKEVSSTFKLRLTKE